MAFEKTVLNQVARVLKTNQQAYFFNGTLFVEAEEKDARRVFSMLCKEYNFKVIPNRVGAEFAYDFV